MYLYEWILPVIPLWTMYLRIPVIYSCHTVQYLHSYRAGMDRDGLIWSTFNSKRVPVHISNNNRKINPAFYYFYFLKSIINKYWIEISLFILWYTISNAVVKGMGLSVCGHVHTCRCWVDRYTVVFFSRLKDWKLKYFDISDLLFAKNSMVYM